MLSIKRQKNTGIDLFLVAALLFITLAGLFTIKSFEPAGEAAGFFIKQIYFFSFGYLIMVLSSYIDTRFFSRTSNLITLYLFGILTLVLVFFLGQEVNGARSWFQLGTLSFQPSDPVKIILIFVLAKYLSRRHVEIKNFRHIVVTGLYFAIPFILVSIQPDFGSAMIFFAIWFGMISVSGISWKHLAVLASIGILAFAGLWAFVFEDYQKTRITSFFEPNTDITNTGYNAYQSAIAVGSGQFTGKGLGYGTQSRLKFLPEHRTDFIFASFSEEWGFVGSLLLIIAYGVIIWRILSISVAGISNFEVLFGVGVSIYLIAHIFINIGMNIGLLPVTGITLPLMSYGGSHLVTEFFAIGLVLGMKRFRQRATDRETLAESQITL